MTATKNVQTIQINLDDPMDITAGFVLRTCFPAMVVQPEISESLAQIVSDFFDSLWAPFSLTLQLMQVHPLGIEEIRKSTMLAAWNQVVFDLFDEALQLFREMPLMAMHWLGDDHG